ncbi:MAG: chorismate mutase / prephenate dehydratase [Verrucomicrobia bacterium]|jgi:chorismate mutase/prephenate dehydratase|nr:MAG: chorismate mutase / prephenate dehydratase [Verrucomicrobiota bacterium]
MKRRVAYLGSLPVTFSYQAATQLGDDLDLTGYPTHGEIYDAVRRGEVDCGVLAVENQLAGIVDETLHAVVQPVLPSQGALAQSNTWVRIVREVAVPVELWLTNQSGRLEEVRVVKTHPIPMRQCKETLDTLRANYPFGFETCASTDAAAREAAANPQVAAISSINAPVGYPNLKIIQRVDDPVPGAGYGNVTRFWVIEPHHPGGVVLNPAEVSKAADIQKICLLFNLGRDEAGGLARSLAVFAEAEINLAIIYPLPRRDRSWEYTFVVEFEVAPEAADRVGLALQRLRTVADSILLGVYPKYRLES